MFFAHFYNKHETITKVKVEFTAGYTKTHTHLLPSKNLPLRSKQ